MTFDQRMEFVAQSIESHDRQLGELTDKLSALAGTVNALGLKIDKLVDVSNRDAVDIAALARIAEAHEHRPDGIEGTN